MLGGLTLTPEGKRQERRKLVLVRVLCFHNIPNFNPNKKHQSLLTIYSIT